MTFYFICGKLFYTALSIRFFKFQRMKGDNFYGHQRDTT